jgi:hypothetical protein
MSRFGVPRQGLSARVVPGLCDLLPEPPGNHPPVALPYVGAPPVRPRTTPRQAAVPHWQSMAKPSQTLAQRALLSPYSRDLAFRLSLGNLSVHGIDCLARLGRSVAVLAIVDLADGLRRWTPIRAAVLASSGTGTTTVRDVAVETWLRSLTLVSR